MKKQAQLEIIVPMSGLSYIGVEASISLKPEEHDELSLTLNTRFEGRASSIPVARHSLQELYDELGKLLAEIPVPEVRPIKPF